MTNPAKIIKKVGSAASKGRTGRNINAKGKKVSEGASNKARPSVRPEDKLKPGMKAKTDELGFSVSRQRVTKGIVPNLGTTKTPFVRTTAEASKKVNEINQNLITLRNAWKSTPPSKRAGIEKSAERLKKQKDVLMKQLKKGK